MREFVAEPYVPSCDPEAAARGADAARAAAEQLSREGAAVRFVRLIFIPQDETCIYLYLADSVEAVRAAAALASLPFEGVCEAVSESDAARSTAR
jgi:hypothetical protein